MKAMEEGDGYYTYSNSSDTSISISSDEVALIDTLKHPISTEVGATGWLTDADKGLTSLQVEASLLKWGRNVIPRPDVKTWVLFARQFIGFMPILMEVAAVISIATLDYTDFGIILALLLINACIGFREEYHAKKALDELTKKVESEITVIRNGISESIAVTELCQGDMVMLVGGTSVPADIQWRRGDVMSIDTAALTGEPVPRKYPGEHGEVILAGTTCAAGESYGQCVAIGTNTEMGQAQADVIKDKSITVVSVFQKKILKVVRITILVSFVFVLGVLFVLGFAYKKFETDWQAAVMGALSIMIAAIPIALPLVMQINMALGASHLAKEHNAIVTSLPALQDIASMSVLCSDKTGTLTTAKMSVYVDSSFNVGRFSKTDILLYAYLASNADKKDDPIDKAIIMAYFCNDEAIDKYENGSYEQVEIIGFTPTVKRVVAFVKIDGKIVTIAKGLVGKVLNTRHGNIDESDIQWQCEGYDDPAWRSRIEERDVDLGKTGYKTIGIAISYCDARVVKDPKFEFVGLLPMIDPPRHDTKATIEALHEANISVKMITGDHTNIGKETARLIGLGTHILPGAEIRAIDHVQERNQLIWDADGFASVLPSDKREVVQVLRSEYGIVTGMTGDGVNDAPALSAAEVGIAVEGSTDAAKNAAALILTEPGLSPIYGAVVTARKIFARIKAYVVYRIAASLILVVNLSLIVYSHGCSVEPLFIIILALLNDISMIPVAYDDADATAKPQLPRAGKLVALSSYFCIAHSIFSVVLFYIIGELLIDEFSLKQCNGETQGFVWLYLCLTTELMIFSARCSDYFWKRMPGWLLMVSVSVTCLICVFVAVYSGTVDKDSEFVLGLRWENVGWVILATFIAFCIVDIGKVWFREMIHDGNTEIITRQSVREGGDNLSTRLTARLTAKLTTRFTMVTSVDQDNDMPYDECQTEAVMALRKKIRQEVHLQSALSEDDRTLNYTVTDNSVASQLFSLQPTFTNGFIRPRQTGQMNIFRKV